MGFSPLIVAVAIVWGRMTSSPGNGGGITVSHRGGRLGQERFDLGNLLRTESGVGNLGSEVSFEFCIFLI